MRLKAAILGLCIVLCLGCSTTKVVVKNFDESEFFTTTKDDITFHCMSDYYIQEILEVKIKKINPD